jgi:hypothetical protein
VLSDLRSDAECIAEQRLAVHAVLIKSGDTIDELLTLLRKLAAQLSKPARRAQDWQTNPGSQTQKDLRNTS